ncbi:diacylglycerol kinase (ATP dependent) [Pseudoalteromonas translucida KMM 520]|uniref:Diacylglycerol kinase (ATP dependent) n=1 Tax=Pseudoalteromonas translucida KMM 520 TaxID=1315283 RepID=A0A0U2XAF0_9GAMM|nr:diacylglycerol kinase (ATP dependent) [Pseudoalteromonas translucida KMM 520]
MASVSSVFLKLVIARTLALKQHLKKKLHLDKSYSCALFYYQYHFG